MRARTSTGRYSAISLSLGSSRCLSPVASARQLWPDCSWLCQNSCDKLLMLTRRFSLQSSSVNKPVQLWTHRLSSRLTVAGCIGKHYHLPVCVVVGTGYDSGCGTSFSFYFIVEPPMLVKSFINRRWLCCRRCNWQWTFVSYIYGIYAIKARCPCNLLNVLAWREERVISCTKSALEVVCVHFNSYSQGAGNFFFKFLRLLTSDPVTASRAVLTTVCHWPLYSDILRDSTSWEVLNLFETRIYVHNIETQIILKYQMWITL